MSGYEILNIYSTMTKEDEERYREKDKLNCIEYIRKLKNSMPKEQLELIWLILTSRGENKLIYGPMPD